jgi:hypothetical protein
MKIFSRFDNSVLFEDASNSMKDTLQAAIAAKANLSRADLYGANLSEVHGLAFQIPQEGELIVYKKLENSAVAKLRIPPDAKRTASPVGRKCRAEFVTVLEITALDGALRKAGKSKYDETKYRVGHTVTPDSYDDDIRVECTHGIHFFLTREEAGAY